MRKKVAGSRATVLGKALFWDQAVGSDGMACASCHFSAGADSRITNQLSPGLLNNPEDLTFGATALDVNFNTSPLPAGQAGLMPAGDRPADSNVTLTPADFPFHKLADIDDRNSDIISTTNDRAASSGAYDRLFTDVGIFDGDEACGDGLADVFHAGGLPARQVEPRNTPTMINSAFFARLFWDGRANNVFNGKNVFGRRDIAADPKARVMVYDGRKSVTMEVVEIEDAALASQAVGPPLSQLEMSCNGRTFADVGRAILNAGLKPLANQTVHQSDSLLGVGGPFGDLRDRSGRGLSNRHKYENLIKSAFPSKYWAAPGRYIVQADGTAVKSSTGYTQMEHNFSLFWGLSIMLYEAELISEESRFDDAEPDDQPRGCLIGGGPGGGAPCAPVAGVLSELELDGLELFRTIPTTPGGVGARCTGCHAGAMFSLATQTAGAPLFAVLRIAQEDPISDSIQPTFHDPGFFAVGPRLVVEDRGLGGTDPYGNPLSFSRQFKPALVASTNGVLSPSDFVDEFNPAPLIPLGGDFLDLVALVGGPPAGFGPAVADHIVRVDGSFKTPSLRNVALTPPYFHYGGYKSLDDVIDFYTRGGSRRDTVVAGGTGDDSGSGPTGEGNADGSLPYNEGIDFGRNVDDNVAQLNLALGGVNGETGEAKDQAYGKRALVAFLKTLTDPKVQCDEAPFDHPELFIFDGHDPVDLNGDGLADDVTSVLPAVGAAGYQGDDARFCLPNAGNLFADGMETRITNFQN